MQKHKNQQFAKFFLKDLKTKNLKFKNKNSDIEEFKFSSPS